MVHIIMGGFSLLGVFVIGGCTLYIYTEVLVGWNLKSAGVPIQCDGGESQLINCSVDDDGSMNCRGGATTITCFATDGIVYYNLLVVNNNMFCR